MQLSSVNKTVSLLYHHTFAFLSYASPRVVQITIPNPSTIDISRMASCRQKPEMTTLTIFGSMGNFAAFNANGENMLYNSLRPTKYSPALSSRITKSQASSLMNCAQPMQTFLYQMAVNIRRVQEVHSPVPSDRSITIHQPKKSRFQLV